MARWDAVQVAPGVMYFPVSDVAVVNLLELWQAAGRPGGEFSYQVALRAFSLAMPTLFAGTQPHILVLWEADQCE